MRYYVTSDTHGFYTQLMAALQDAGTALKKCHALTVAGTDTPYLKEIIPAMLNYYETEHYVFTHGWIPCIADRKGYSPITNWREASEQEWLNSRWYNGMDAAWTETEDKTIVCGHWHTSYGHSRYEGKGSEFDEDADFSPYYGPRVIAVDACTAHSGKVNCIVIED